MRRATRRRHVRRHSYKRNPAILGVGLPPISDILYVGAGLVIPPMVANQIMNYLPDSLKTSRAAYYGVKAASVIIPSMLVKRFISQRAGNLILLGGAASFAIDLIREAFPTLLSGASSQPFLGYYPGLAGPRRVRGMGRYLTPPDPAMIGAQTGPVTSALMIQNTPERLNPQTRF